MCIICVELQSGKLLPWEATRNLKEVSKTIDQEHAKQVLKLIENYSSYVELCEICEQSKCCCKEGKN